VLQAQASIIHLAIREQWVASHSQRRDERAKTDYSKLLLFSVMRQWARGSVEVVVAKVRRQEREGNTGCKRWEQLIQKLNTDDWPRHRPTVHQKQFTVRASSFPPH